MTDSTLPGALVPDHVGGRRSAVVDQDGTVLTYKDLQRRSSLRTEELRHDGVVPGDVVGIATDRTIDTVVLLVALWRMGAVPLVLDPARPDLTAAVDDVGGWLVTPDHPIRRPVGAMLRPEPGDAVWVPTSGSTGPGRIVRLTSANVAAAVTASRHRLGTGPDDRWLAVLPLFHVGGLSVVWRSFAAGGTVVLHDRFEVTQVVDAIENGGITAGSLVPTMVARLVDTGLRVAPALRFVLVGGAAADPSLLADATTAGLPVLATYGATEACSQIATPHIGDPPGARGDVGIPLDDMTVAVVDGEGHPVAAGEVGHLVIDGPSVFPGYVGAPGRIAAHPTGDLGRWDGERLVVIGRADDVVISGGVNVAPADVEVSVGGHPDVAVCVMVGVPDTEWGSVVVVVVEPRPGAVIDVASLDAHVAEQLPPSHRPRRWVVAEEIPLLANGKIDRQQVQRLAGVTEGAA